MCVAGRRTIRRSIASRKQDARYPPISSSSGKFGQPRYDSAVKLHRLCIGLFFVSFAASAAVDDFGRKVTPAHSPPRIVSLAPGATEMLFAAGAGKYLLATSEYSDEPAAARRVPRIGDSNAIDLERLVVLRPDVVVVWPGGNNAAQIGKITSLKIPIYQHRINALDDISESLRRMGALAGTQKEADAAAAGITARLQSLRARYAKKKPVRVLLQVWNRPIYTIGGKQIMSDVLRACGAENIFGDLPELGPVVELEAVIARKPEMIIASAPREPAEEWAKDWKKFGDLPAVRTNNVIVFEDQRLSRLGPSVLDAGEALCKEIDAARARLNP
jgi:iron complex transport system substrate-binding protein